MKNVMLLTGAGQIGMAIARRVGYGMKIVIADKKAENAQAISKTMNEAGFDTVAVQMDLASRTSIQAAIAKAQQYGPITKLVNAAGVSPSQAPVDVILKVDLYGTAVLLEEVGKVIAPGGVGVTISSPATGCPRSRPRRMRCWPAHRLRSCCSWICSGRSMSGIRFTPTRSPSAAMRSVSWPSR